MSLICKTLLVLFFTALSPAVFSQGADIDDLMGLSGPWYDPSASGDGFNIVAFERPGKSPALVFFFYGYDANGNRIWLVSKVVSPENLSSVQGVEMRYPSGTGFEGAGDHSLAAFGELDFEFTGCGTGRFTLRKGAEIYRIWDAVQLADIPGPGCLLGDGARKYETVAGLSGNWYVTNEPGDGLNLIQTDYGLAGYFYGYDKDGEPLWLLSKLYKGPIIPGRKITVDLRQGSGGNLSDVSGAELETWGSMTMMFRDCASVEVSLDGLDGKRSSSMTLLVQVGETRCEAPGAITLSQSTLTFEGTGDSRQVDFIVTDGSGSPVSSDHVEYSFSRDGVVSVGSFANGSATIAAITNQITDTHLRFWDPVHNAVQDMPVAIVDLRPGIKFVSESNVNSWVIPTEAQNREIRLKSNAETEDIQAGDYIASEAGLTAKVSSVSIQAEEVVVDGEFAALTDIYWNLKISMDEQLSTTQFTEKRSNGNGLESLKSIKKPGQKKFELINVSNSVETLNCESESASVFDQFEHAPTFKPEFVNARMIDVREISEGAFITDGSIVGFEADLFGEVDLGFAQDAQLGLSVHCVIADIDLRTPPAVTHFGAFAGVMPIEVGFDFSINQHFPDPVRLYFGATISAGIDFEAQEYFGEIRAGLPGDRWLSLKDFTLDHVVADTYAAFEPYITGLLGLEWSGGITTSTFADASIGLPYNFSWELLDSVESLEYRGPRHAWSLEASAGLRGTIDSMIFEYIGTDPIPFTPYEELFPPQNYLLYESPSLRLTEIGCGANCGVGDARTFKMDIEQSSLFGGEVHGYGFLLTDKSNTEAQQYFVSGSTPGTAFLTITPEEEGALAVMPRFQSNSFRVIYGDTPLMIDVSGGIALSKLNDTGIDWGGGYPGGNNATCTGETITAQDCSHGRDATHDDDTDGHAGFSFTKLDTNGNDLPAAAGNWSCIRDEVTGLTWEAKTDDGGLQDADNTYSWYNPDSSTNGGSSGTQSGGVCSGSNCDTYSYVQAVNAKAQALCGARDWRMPWLGELQSIVDYSRFLPSIDTAYFPLQRNSYIWSGSPSAYNSGYAWDIYFSKGSINSDARHFASRVRLVRGGQ